MGFAEDIFGLDISMDNSFWMDISKVLDMQAISFQTLSSEVFMDMVAKLPLSQNSMIMQSLPVLLWKACKNLTMLLKMHIIIWQMVKLILSLSRTYDQALSKHWLLHQIHGQDFLWLLKLLSGDFWQTVHFWEFCIPILAQRHLPQEPACNNKLADDDSSSLFRLSDVLTNYSYCISLRSILDFSDD